MLVFNLIVHGKNLVLLVLANPHAGVLHLEAQRLVLLIGDPHDNFTLLGKFHGVTYQVPQNLAQAGPVGGNHMR